MSFGYSVGDFIAVSKLIYTVIDKCKAASREFTDLQRILHATRSSIDSAHHAVAEIHEGLPSVHRNAIATNISGIARVVNNIALDLDQYAKIRPGGGPQFAKLHFALFSNPREVESKLTLWLSALNTTVAAIVW